MPRAVHEEARERQGRNRLSAADEVFAALDGRMVCDGDRCWEIRIWGIHAGSGRLWLQVGFLGRGLAESMTATVPVAKGRARDVLLDFLTWWQSIDRTELFTLKTA
jgi:hypothetical protein